MVIAITVFFATWLLVTFIGWSLSDATMKEVASHGGCIMFMLVFGWIPAVIVSRDVYAVLEGE